MLLHCLCFGMEGIHPVLALAVAYIIGYSTIQDLGKFSEGSGLTGQLAGFQVQKLRFGFGILGEASGVKGSSVRHNLPDDPCSPPLPASK